MKYVQANSDSYVRTVDDENTVWDATHYCRPSKLTVEEATYFQVYPLTLVTPPAYNRITQGLRQVDPVYSGTWMQAWEVYDLPQQEADANHQAVLVAERAAAKSARSVAVDSIQVTTASGRVFDGDETSQTRMTRAIIAMQATGTPSITWVLADNTPASVGVAELIEALALSGAAQSAIWVLA